MKHDVEDEVIHSHNELLNMMVTVQFSNIYKRPRPWVSLQVLCLSKANAKHQSPAIRTD